MFVLAADDVTKEELKSVSKKIEKQLAKWEEKDQMLAKKRKHNESLPKDDCSTSCPQKRARSADEDVCEMAIDVDAKGHCTFISDGTVNRNASTHDSYCVDAAADTAHAVSQPQTKELRSSPERDGGTWKVDQTAFQCSSASVKCCESERISTVETSHRQSTETKSVSAALDQEKSNDEDQVPQHTAMPEPSKYVALDCEFVGVGKDISALGRCSIVDFDCNVLCDVYAQPNQPITHYRTKWSGLTRGIMRQHSIPVDIALNKIKQLIQDKIVVGHALWNDFTVLGIQHPCHHIRDTSKCDLLKSRISGGPSLKNMSLELLGKEIQRGRHCSVVDAQTAMELYRQVRNDWEQKILSEPPQTLPPVIESNSGKKKKKKRRPKNRQPFNSNMLPISHMLPLLQKGSSVPGSTAGLVPGRHYPAYTRDIDTGHMQGQCAESLPASVIRGYPLNRNGNGTQTYKHGMNYTGYNNGGSLYTDFSDVCNAQEVSISQLRERRESGGYHVTKRRRLDSCCSNSSVSDMNPADILQQDKFWPQ